MTKAVNRLKVVLVEQKKTGKWLAEQLGKDPSTVSKWCSNTTQPPLDMLVNIAKAGFFSSDRTIAEYNRDIWKLKTAD